MAPDDVKVEFAKVDKGAILILWSTEENINIVANRKSSKCVSAGNVVALFEYVLDAEMFGSFPA